jgi:hypothetical protein
VSVDCLSIAADEGHLVEALSASSGFFAPAPVLICLKLRSARLRDRADIVELVKAGIDVEETRQYLVRQAPRFVDLFDEAVPTARAEEQARRSHSRWNRTALTLRAQRVYDKTDFLGWRSQRRTAASSCRLHAITSAPRA